MASANTDEFDRAQAFKAEVRTGVGQRPPDSRGIGDDLDSMVAEAMSVRQAGVPRFKRIYVDGVARDLSGAGRTLNAREFILLTALNDTPECRHLNNQLNTRIYAHLAGTDSPGLMEAYSRGGANNADWEDVSFINPLSGLPVTDRGDSAPQPSEVNFTARWKPAAETVEVTLYAWSGEEGGADEWTSEREISFPVRLFAPDSRKCISSPVRSLPDNGLEGSEVTPELAAESLGRPAWEIAWELAQARAPSP